jgi:hypothetical protein
MPSGRWAYLLDFLYTDQRTIKSLLHATVDPEMIQTEISLTNILTGIPMLSASVRYPDGGNRVVVCTIVRPPLYDPLQVHEEIDQLSMSDSMMTVSNQVDVYL